MEGSDIVMTCTQKLPHPIIPAESFKPGMMGGGLEAGRAWPGALLHGVDKVITDHLEQTLSYNAPGVFEGGMPTFHATLGELVNGTKLGRENDEERILAFNIGFAAEDIALGQLIYEKAKERGIGTILPLMEVEDIY
jgi:ornithine cyclodeaminase/alanine dehydrogenase-like protein (mu-crystallin family)